MTNLTSSLNSILQIHHNARLNPSPLKCSDTKDEFLKEAYRINAHITSLHTYLLSIRQPYLSTAPSRRPTTTALTLTNPQRTLIDSESKSLLRDLHASIQQLSSAATLRQDTALQLQRRKRGGALLRWANGGRNNEDVKKEEEEGPLRTDRTWRESVLWYLGRGLEGAGEVHRGMMEKRYEREVERSRSVLYMSQGAKTGRVSMLEASTTNGTMPDTATAAPPASRSRSGAANAADPMGMEEEREIERQLSPDQLQLFARENQDLLKQYEDTLDQVRTAESSLLEISSLQSTLSANLASQSAHVEQLVADSMSTSGNVERGNRELKRAAERPSVARGVFWATCGFSVALVVWDLIF